jgi:catechol 2,3-dioxygenase-like lactoylglutathione lyase family enzyme
MEFNSLIPELIVSDLAQSIQFYRDVLGFKVDYERSEEKFMFISLGSSQLMPLQENSNTHSTTGELDAPRGRGVNFSIRFDSRVEIAGSLDATGHELKIPIRDQWHREDDQLHGEKQLWVMDPDGYLLRFVIGLGTKSIANR